MKAVMIAAELVQRAGEEGRERERETEREREYQRTRNGSLAQELDHRDTGMGCLAQECCWLHCVCVCVCVRIYISGGGESKRMSLQRDTVKKMRWKGRGR